MIFENILDTMVELYTCYYSSDNINDCRKLMEVITSDYKLNIIFNSNQFKKIFDYFMNNMIEPGKLYDKLYYNYYEYFIKKINDRYEYLHKILIIKKDQGLYISTLNNKLNKI